MNVFAASNGVKVIPHDTSIGVRMSVRDEEPVDVPGAPKTDSIESYLDPRQADALREFYDFAGSERWQARRDEELGRWRWPENPEWVAIEGERVPEGRTVVVVNERTLDRFWFNERVRQADGTVSVAHCAGRAYFAADPERKPWQRAQVGEVWVLSTTDGETDAYTAMPVRGGGLAFEAPEGRYPLDDADIESARRIWPEDAS